MTTLIQERASAAAPRALPVRRRWTGWLATAAFTAVLAYLVLVPLYRLQAAAFADDGHGYRTALGSFRLIDTLRTTAVLALGSLAIAMVLGTGLAWAASRLPPRYRSLRSLPILPIVMPAVANVIGWAFLLTPGPGYLNAVLRFLPWWSDLSSGPVDVYSAPWIVIITGFALTSFVYLFVAAGLQNISQEHIEAAQVAGSSSAGVFFKVVLPLLRPSLVYGGGVVLLLGLGQFTAPLLLGTNSGYSVVTTEIYRNVSESPIDYGVAAAWGSPLVLFGVAVVVAQKLGLGDQRRFVTHGGKGFRSTTRTSRWAAVAIVVYTLISTVLPLVALIIVAVSKFWSASIDPSAFTMQNLVQAFGSPDILEAILTSVGASLLAMVIVLPTGFVVASLMLRGRRFRVMRVMMDFIVSVPLGVPAAIFGAGFLLTYTRPPLVLYGTTTVIVVVYVTLMLPFATRMILSGMMALGSGYREASRASGAGSLATDLRIVIPLLRGSLAGAAALVFVLLTHEFSASLLVRSSTTQVMGTVLFDYWSNGSFPIVASIALIMTAVTAVGVVLAMAFGGADVLDKL